MDDHDTTRETGRHGQLTRQDIRNIVNGSRELGRAQLARIREADQPHREASAIAQEEAEADERRVTGGRYGGQSWRS